MRLRLARPIGRDLRDLDAGDEQRCLHEPRLARPHGHELRHLASAADRGAIPEQQRTRRRRNGRFTPPQRKADEISAVEREPQILAYRLAKPAVRQQAAQLRPPAVVERMRVPERPQLAPGDAQVGRRDRRDQLDVAARLEVRRHRRRDLPRLGQRIRWRQSELSLAQREQQICFEHARCELGAVAAGGQAAIDVPGLDQAVVTSAQQRSVCGRELPRLSNLGTRARDH